LSSNPEKGKREDKGPGERVEKKKKEKKKKEKKTEEVKKEAAILGSSREGKKKRKRNRSHASILRKKTTHRGESRVRIREDLKRKRKEGRFVFFWVKKRKENNSGKRFGGAPGRLPSF